MKKFAIFGIGGETFGIAIEKVVEILNPRKVFSVPGLPMFLSGVMNVRGTVIPLLDLRNRFGKAPAGKKERIVVVRLGSEKIGCLVDDIKEILSLSEEDISRPPRIFRGFKTEYLTGIGRKGEQIILILNLDNILTSEEKICLRNLLTLWGTVVQDLEKKLEDDDIEVRRRAVEQLREIKASSTIPLLLKALGDMSWRVRKKAGDILFEDYQIEEYLPGMIQLLYIEDNAGAATRRLNPSSDSAGEQHLS